MFCGHVLWGKREKKVMIMKNDGKWMKELLTGVLVFVPANTILRERLPDWTKQEKNDVNVFIIPSDKISWKGKIIYIRRNYKPSVYR